MLRTLCTSVCIFRISERLFLYCVKGDRIYLCETPLSFWGFGPESEVLPMYFSFLLSPDAAITSDLDESSVGEMERGLFRMESLVRFVGWRA
jgi:hypothetical protein